MGLLTLGIPQSKDSCLVWGSFITDHPPGPTKSPFTTCRVRGVYITQILHGYPITKPPSRNRVYFCPFRKPNLWGKLIVHIWLPICALGGRRSPVVTCWDSDHWVASSNPLRGKFRHWFRLIIPGVCLAQFSLNNVHKRGQKHHHFISYMCF